MIIVVATCLIALEVSINTEVYASGDFHRE